MRIRTTALPLALGMWLSCLGLPLLVADGLTAAAKVRIQSNQVSAGWHDGTVQIVEGCTLIWTPDPGMPGGRVGLGLMFIQKLQRQQGSGWVDVSVADLMRSEPARCQQGNG